MPPRSFFPQKYQGKRLLIVPSCEEHNGGNSKDVDYVRGVLCIQYGTNTTAEEVMETAKRSWDHSPKLFDRTFAEIVEAEVLGGAMPETIGVFKIDLARVKTVMRAIAHAIYYVERGHAWAWTFEIFCAFHSEKSLQGLPDGSEEVGNWLARREYAERATLHPDVFEYQIHDSDELIIAMRYYGGPWIYARRVGRVVTAPGPALLTAI